MERIAIDDLEPGTSDVGAEARGISTALGATDVTINHYTVAPGERISGLHAHGDQEEIFLVDGGVATIETLDGKFEVESGAAVRFGVGESQSVTNGGPQELAVLAIGAPPESEEVRIPLACPDCGHEFRRPVLLEGGPGLVCPDCGAAEAAECLECGSVELHAALGDDGDPVSVCGDCGATS
jgi:mannose-6-phosphate isomerase-like protein (cupin superfamily)